MNMFSPGRRERREEPAFHYELLENPKTREDLLRGMDNLMETIQDRDVDTVVFLDRSARPLSWLMRERWRLSDSDKPMPEMKFVNIGLATSVHPGSRDLTIPGGGAYYPYPSSSSRQDFVRKKMMSNQWLSPEDVPTRWSEGLLDHEDEVQELEDVFGSNLDGKRVLVVDEMVNTGKNLLTAVSLFSLMFPKLKEVQGTAFKLSKGMGYDEDRKAIPWLKMPGMTGVLELPDRLFQSGAITAENLESIRDALRQERKREVKTLGESLLPAMNVLDKVVDQWDEIKAHKGFDQRYITVIERDLESARKTMRAFLDTGEHGFTPEYEKQMYDLSIAFGGLSNDVGDAPFAQMLHEAAHLTDKVDYEKGHKTLQEIDQYLDADYADLEALRARATTLRKEIKELAKETYEVF